MPWTLRRCWPVAKALICLAILTLIGRRFAQDLAQPELWQRSFHPAWLALCGVLYIAGLSFSALFWGRLLTHLGHRPPALSVARAYFVGHLGKYVPGKAWALVLRAGLIRGERVPVGLAGLTAFYEVLTTMCAGSVLAALLFAVCGLGNEGASSSWGALFGLLRLERPEGGVVNRWTAVALSLLLAVATGVPLWPGVFNRLAPRLVPGFKDREGDLPRLRVAHLAEGLFLAGCGWLLLGGSLFAALLGTAGPVVDATPLVLARLTAAVALAYVAGFVVLVAPSGLGVREFFLALILTPELTRGALDPAEAPAVVVLTVLVLRLVWTLSELLLAGGLWLGYHLPMAAPRPALRDGPEQEG
jgi:hypothetical protein